MAKFKVGDRVRIIKSLDDIPSMMDKIGQIMTIEKVWDGQADSYILEEDWAKFIWRNKELELVERPLTPELQRVKATLKSITHLQKEKNNINNIHFIDTIAFNKKTFKTTIVLKYGSDEYDTVEVISNKKDFVDFRVGFLMTWLKAHLSGSEFKTLIGQLFFKGKPQITFLRGFSLRYFDSLRQMDKVLEAIKDEKDSVNIGGNIIELVWKGKPNE